MGTAALLPATLLLPSLVNEYGANILRRSLRCARALVNTDRHYIDARMQTGEVVRYELLLGYRDTLIYAHGMTLCQVMDLLVNHYCIGVEEP